jgi:L-asparaginase
MKRSKILLVSLGGTIAMTKGAQGGIVPTLTAADFVKTVPGLDAMADIETASPLQKPGPSLTFDDLISLARFLDERLAGPLDGAVVIQGTDTIEETAFALDCLVESSKPVVVTGAMRGSQAAGADGPANILASVIAAASPDAVRRGVSVILNDEIHSALLVQKSHTALPSAFRSPLGGPVGLVVEGRAHFHLTAPRAPRIKGDFAPEDMPVALVKMALGDDGRILRALPGLDYRGVVIEGMGAGHVPLPVAEIVSELTAVMPVLLASRADTGPVFTRTYGFPGSEIDLLARGALSTGILSGVKARVLLTLALRCGWAHERIAGSLALQRA